MSIEAYDIVIDVLKAVGWISILSILVLSAFALLEDRETDDTIQKFLDDMDIETENKKETR